MNKTYWLIKEIKTTGHKNPIQVIDRLVARGLREAEGDFKTRNNFTKLSVKADLVIVRADRYFN